MRFLVNNIIFKNNLMKKIIIIVLSMFIVGCFAKQPCTKEKRQRQGNCDEFLL